MTNSIGDNSDQRNLLNDLPILKILPILTAMAGAVGGLVLVLTAADQIQNLIGVRIIWWQGMLLGALFSGLAGWLVLRAIVKEIKQTSAAIAELGLEPMDHDRQAQLKQDVSRLLSERASISNCYLEKKPGVTLVLAEATISSLSTGERSIPSDGDRSQTCLIAEFDDLFFPDFQLRPENAASRLLDKWTGDQDIDFEDSQNFSRLFLLTGEEREKVRQLFSMEARTFFESFAGWTVVAGKNRIVLFRANRVVRPDDLKEFLGTTSRMVDVLARNVQGIEVARIDQPMTMAGTMGKADEVGGIFGYLMKGLVRSQVVDQTDMTAALNSPVPRPIPSSLRRIWRADRFLVSICSVFFLAGVVVLLLGLMIRMEMKDRAIAIAVGLGVMLIFGTVVGIVKMLERRRLRLFSYGRVLQARIVSVTDTPFVNGNERVFKVQFQIGDGNRGATASTKLQGMPAEQARRFAESGQTIRILQDRDVADRYLLVDCYSLL